MSGKLAVQLAVAAIQVILLIIQWAVIRASEPKREGNRERNRPKAVISKAVISKAIWHPDETVYKTKQTGDMSASQVLDYMAAKQTCLQAQSAAKRIYGNALVAPSIERGTRYVGRSYAYKQRPIPIHHTKYSVKRPEAGFYEVHEHLRLPLQA